MTEHKEMLSTRSSGASAHRFSPLVVGTAIVVLSLIGFWWSAGVSRAAQTTAVRSQENAQRAAVAAKELAALALPKLSGDSTQKITALIDKTLRGAEIGDHALRSESIRSLGFLGQTTTTRQQARVELAGLSLTESGMIVDTLESTDPAIWLESTELTAAGNNQWTLVLEIDWLAN